ncbi:peptidoglycan-binding protein [Nonomuraea typhae]|uniref:Peptidoglycan-binding protein n=1 Tax=Nonomuraea typhae TaxID=2603600 RepID=A0ABW7ZAH8_9ACTN
MAFWAGRELKPGRATPSASLYGPRSQGACRRIQRAAGLRDDGSVGPPTWAATASPA